MSNMDPLDVGADAPATSLSQDEIEGLWRQREFWRNMQVNKGIDGDADTAAQSQQLESTTGVPASLIADNFDQFVNQQKKIAAQHIVSANPELEDYVMSHPLATTVSNDDWANLDKFTRESSGGLIKSLVEMTKSPIQDAVGDIAEAGVKGAAEGLMHGGLEPTDAETSAMDPAKNSLGATGAFLSKQAFGVADIATRLMATLSGGMMGAGVEAGGKVGFGESESRRAIEAVTNMGMAEAGMHMHPAEAAPAQTAGDLARPWQAAGKEPPAGLHPEIDAAKAELNETGLKEIDKDLANATASTTRERSPEVFAKLTEQMYGESTIGLHADAALALYGDKPPTVDDGLLGWVPGIEDQLAAARDTGADVSIPLKDWIAKVDPAVAKGLHDDLRVWPGGVTANESKVLPTEPKQIVDEALPNVRAAAGLEPKFSMGDRKLGLALFGKEADEDAAGTPYEMHDYDIHDENGQAVGRMRLVPGADGKTLYVDWIGGKAGLWANSFGPALVRDLKAQLKGLYPDYEYLTGHRVTGARVGLAAGEGETPMPLPRVRLEADPNNITEHQKTLDVFQNGWVNHLNSSLDYLPWDERVTPEQNRLGTIAAEEVRRITGDSTDITPTRGIRSSYTGQRAAGSWVASDSARPEILLDLMRPDVVGTGRHEAIHQLRGYNFFKPEEWDTLEAAARNEDWIGRYNIQGRYGHLEIADQLEEAVAEGFREWAAQAPDIRPKTGVGAIFQKIMDLFDSIKQRLGFGSEDSWQSVFERVHSGEVGARGPGAPPEGAMDVRTKLSADEQQKAVVEGIDNLQAASIGMDTPRFQKIKEAIRAQAESDLGIAKARAEKEVAKRQTKEWKANRSDMAKEVSTEIRQRPDIAADLFLGSGELGGKKIQQRFTLAEDRLTPEQKAALPEHYVSKNGMDPDQVGGLFGYSSGDEMVHKLGEIEALKNSGGTRMRTEDFIRKAVQAETDRRMKARYGHTAAQALDDALDSALSESSRNVSYEEYRAVAEAQGVTVYDRSVMKQAAKNLLDTTTVGNLNSQRLFQQMGMHSRNAQKAMADGNWSDAVVHMQRQSMTHELAGMAAVKEKEIAKFEKDAKAWGKYKYGKAATSMAADYATVIQQALSQIGKKVQVPAAWLEREMQESGAGTDMRSFVDDKTKWGAVINPWEDLYDPKAAFNFKDLTVDQFDRANDFLRSLVKSGRDEKRLYKDGAAFDFAEKREEMLKGLDRLGSVGDGLVGKTIRTTNSLMIQMETYIDKLDRWDPTGVWNDFLMRPLFETEHVEMDRVREVTKQIHEIINLKFDNKEIPSIFKNPRNGSEIVATRRTLWAAMLNQGTKDNIDAFAKSWGLAPDGVRSWINSHATPEDWAGVQKIWDLFQKTGDWSDQEYRRLSDRPMKWIAPQAVQTPHGEFAGGYYPIMHHPEFPGKSANLLGLSAKALFGDGYSTGFAPGAGYRIERTNYVAPMALDLNQVAGRLTQQIHDGAMRGAILQAAKILRDPDLKDAMIEKLGLEVHDAFVQHLRRVANGQSPSADMSLSMQRVLMAGDYIRRNVISNMIGLNLGTVEKHGPTAFVTSLSQLGVGKMLGAYKDIFMGDEEGGVGVRKMIYEKSALMRGRQRYWMDSIYGSVGKIHDDNTAIDKFLKFREWSQWAATQPVALSDALSAEPLWWGMYKDAKAAGEDEGSAVFMADKAVRKAHGAGGTVGQPLIVNEVSKWFTPMYNFYNSVLNKAVESYWRAGEAQRAFSEGDYTRMQKNMKAAAVGGFVSLVMPPLIHDLVSPPKIDPHDSWELRILKYIGGPMAAFIPGGANVAEYLTGSSTPDVGLQTAAMKQAMDFARDLKNHKPGPVANQKMIRDGGSFLGWLGVGAGRQLGVWAGAAYGLDKGIEHSPRNLEDVHNLVRFGTERRK